jgi:Glutathione S-transferase, N-terminal domain
MVPPLTYELWQTEWCFASRRVRQRLTELGIDYLTRQVPVDKDDRFLLRERGTDTIPVLVAPGEEPLVEDHRDQRSLAGWALFEGLEEGGEGAHESEHDQHSAGDRDRSEWRVRSAPDPGEGGPGEGEDDYGDQSLA